MDSQIVGPDDISLTPILDNTGSAGQTAVADEENQIAVEIHHNEDVDVRKPFIITPQPALQSPQAPLAPSKMYRSTSLDTGTLVPSPPTPMKRFESDPVTAAEKLEAQEHHIAPSTSTLPAKSNSSSPALLVGNFRRMWSFQGLKSLAFPEASKLDPDTFYCKVCLENCSLSLGFTIACSAEHKYCRDCLTGYYTAQVNDGVIDLFCPGVSDGCQGSLSADELRSLVSDDVFERHNRFVQVKKNPLYRECPSCNVGVTLADQTAKVKCGSCSTEYCFFHANAHVGMTCEQYARSQSRRTRQELNASNAFVNRNTKPCPYCTSPTEKNGGCNHM
jgi:ribosomal protein S27AE